MKVDGTTNQGEGCGPAHGQQGEAGLNMLQWCVGKTLQWDLGRMGAEF